MVTLQAEPEPLKMDLKRTAVMVIDMQNAFVSKGGMFDMGGQDISLISRVIGPNREIIEAARGKGVKVVYAVHRLTHDGREVGPLSRYRFHPGWNNPEMRKGSILEDTWGTEIIDELAPPAAFLVREEHGFLHFGETIRVKARPMVGVIGVAPLEPVHSFYPGPHGGNLDINEVRPGAVVHLPVRVEGALLALGDVHASMGDGELTGGGVDIPAEVTITTVVVKNQCLDFPLIETAEAWCACANAPGLQEAVRLATLRMTGLLASRLDMSREQAFILLGAAGDARIGQAAALDIDATAYVKVSKDILPTVF